MPLLRLLPRPLKGALRRWHQYYTLRSALSTVERRLQRNEPVDATLAQRLVYGWGNAGWSADTSLIEHLVNERRTFAGVMLECGPGLSTILMLLVAKRTGARVISLEHNEGWHSELTRRFKRLGLDYSNLLLAPLRAYGGYQWYERVPALDRIGRINLVLCDGPPGDTPGGRFGLLPQMVDSLDPNAEIIVDDSHRTDESAMIERWITESTGNLRVKRAEEVFTVLRWAPENT